MDLSKNLALFLEFFAKSAQQHPKYKTSEWTLEDVYAHFINTFDDKSNPNGQVRQYSSTRTRQTLKYSAETVLKLCTEYTDLIDFSRKEGISLNPISFVLNLKSFHQKA